MGAYSMSLQKKLRPPHYAADKAGSYIHPTDESVDTARVESELEQLRADALAANAEATSEEIGEAMDAHPLRRYFNGSHRYDLDAVDYYKGAPVKIRDYFTKADPIVFTLRRLTVDEVYQVDAVRSPLARWSLACRLGVTGCTAIKLRTVDGRLDDASMRALYDASETLPIDLGVAVIQYNRPLSEAESFR